MNDYAACITSQIRNAGADVGLEFVNRSDIIVTFGKDIDDFAVGARDMIIVKSSWCASVTDKIKTGHPVPCEVDIERDGRSVLLNEVLFDW